MNDQLPDRTTLMFGVGAWIKKERQARRWSQSELGDKLPVHRNSISRWETGSKNDRCDIALVDFVALCTVFGRDPGKTLARILTDISEKKSCALKNT